MENQSISWDTTQILDNTIEGIMIIEDGFIKDVNKSLLEILQYTNKSDLIGNLAVGVLMPTLTKKFIEFNTVLFQEVSLLTKEGTIIPAIIKIKDITLNNQEYKMVSILDMTEIKEKETLLIESAKLAEMGEMISVIAHQWRQPLSSISSIVTRLIMKTNMKSLSPELLIEKANEINKYLQYMSKTIDDFRNFFTPTKSKELVSLNEIVSNTQHIIEKTFQAKGIALEIDDTPMKKQYFYKNELSQVILNLLNNAKDALLEKQINNPKVCIKFKEDEKDQYLYIQDNAGGIDVNIMNKIFDPYFSTKDKKNGTGLGLHITKTIIEKHSNGKIKVSNTKDGAIFEITLEK